jgi:hypothetical protein
MEFVVSFKMGKNKDEKVQKNLENDGVGIIFFYFFG